MLASEGGHVDLVRELLNAQADVDEQDKVSTSYIPAMHRSLCTCAINPCGIMASDGMRHKCVIGVGFSTACFRRQSKYGQRYNLFLDKVSTDGQSINGRRYTVYLDNFPCV